MTNILATIVVCIVTNVTHWDNEVVQPHAFMQPIGEPMGGTVLRPATEKTETVTVTEITTLVFNWQGKEWKAKIEKVLSETITKWKKKEEWAKE